MKFLILKTIFFISSFSYSQNLDSILYRKYNDSIKYSIEFSDIFIFNKIKKDFIESQSDSSLLLIRIAEQFLGTKYGSGNRGKKSENKILINFQELDCVTYVENVVSLYYCFKKYEYDFGKYLEIIENIKYRNGIKIEFPSRLHYYTEWITDNIKRSNLEEVSSTIDSIIYDKKINYMSKNRSLYPQLKDSLYYTEIKQIEDSINNRILYYLPKGNFENYKTNIKHGDIIAFTSSIEGLDVSHTGFAYWKNNELYLLHASSKYKKVLISPETLKIYLNNNQKITGIIVCRLKF